MPLYRAIMRRLLTLLILACILAGLVALAARSMGRGLDAGPTTAQKTSQLVARIRGQSKLVVASQALTLSVERSDAWYLFTKIYMGTTRVKVRVDNCQVQYVIPGSGVVAGDLRYEPRGHRLLACLPRPVVDPDMVEIPADPGCWYVCKSSGWARFDKHEMEAQVRAGLRDKLIGSAREGGFDQALDLVARAQVRQFVRQFMSDPGLDVQVAWR